MPDLRLVYRFRDHAVAGVSWRPTPFVDEVNSSRVCGLCRMVAKRTVLLPCDHALCPSCQAASLRDGSGRCPLDQEPFEEAECTGCDFPSRKANALKVYCWNEAHGCEYQGAMEDMLKHFENECTFHSVECLRCGATVLHRELATHYVTGCSTSLPAPRTENTSSESIALTLQDVKNALEEVKALLRDPNHDQLLPAIQSQVNELTEQVTNQESRLAEIAGEVRSSASAETAQHAAPAHSTVLQEPISRRHPADATSTSSSLSCSQERLMEQTPEDLFNLPPRVLEQMQKTSIQDYPQHVIEYFGPPNGECHFTLASPLSGAPEWGGGLRNVNYVVRLRNCAFVSSGEEKLLCRITVLPRWDARFAVEVCYTPADFPRNRLTMRIIFGGAAYGSSYWLPRFNVGAYDSEREALIPFTPRDIPHTNVSVKNSRVYSTRSFEITCRELERHGFLRHGRRDFNIYIYY